MQIEAEPVQRKPYVKPQIERVHLRTNETMSTSCRTSSGNAEVGDDCVVEGCQFS
jgi:hypothetical protein